MPYQTLPAHEENDELQLCYLLITSRHIERQGMDWLPYAAVVVAFMAFGALSLLGVL